MSRAPRSISTRATATTAATARPISEAASPSPAVDLQSSLVIDCDSCQMRDITCGDCVISFLIGPPQPRSSQVTLEESEAQAIAALAGGGLVPPLRVVPPPVTTDGCG
jgi:hypothetical protein